MTLTRAPTHAKVWHTVEKDKHTIAPDRNTYMGHRGAFSPGSSKDTCQSYPTAESSNAEASVNACVSS